MRMSSDRETDELKTTEELFSASFEGDYDDEAPWDAVRALRQRNDDEVFHLAMAYSRSETPIQRSRALDVLAQLGAGDPLSERPHFSESVSTAFAHLGDESASVASSAAWALAHLKGDTAVSALIEVRRSADPCVRWAVAYGVAGSERPEAIRTLMDLMEDDDDEVRNWATFGLASAYVEGSGRLGTMDSTDIRTALRKRMNDPFREVRNEAVWGLAVRRDPAALRVILDRLNSAEWVAGDEMAAAEALDLDYKSPVEALRSGLGSLLTQMS
jgi:HEAT repeat protein